MNIISHRGYRNRWPENTLGAFEDAIAFSKTNNLVRGVELDIQLTGDGEVIVIHNPSLWVADREEWVFSHTPYDQIATYASQCSDVRGRICPRFEDVLKFIDHRLVIYCEIKTYDYRFSSLVDRIVDLLDDYGDGDIVLHSFNAEMMKLVMSTFRPTGRKFGFLLSDPEMLNTVAELAPKLDYIHPQFGLFLNHPEKFTAMGRPLNVWTPNCGDHIASLIECDKGRIIEGIMTDDVSLVRHI